MRLSATSELLSKKAKERTIEQMAKKVSKEAKEDVPVSSIEIPLHDKLIYQGKKGREDKEKMRKEKEWKDQEQCTFKPVTGKKPKRSLKRDLNTYERKARKSLDQSAERHGLRKFSQPSKEKKEGPTKRRLKPKLPREASSPSISLNISTYKKPQTPQSLGQPSQQLNKYLEDQTQYKVSPEKKNY